MHSNFAHLSTSLGTICDHNCALQVELSSLKEQQSEGAFLAPRTITTSPPSPAPAQAPIGVSNSFSTLTDEVSDDDALPTAPSARRMSLMILERQPPSPRALHALSSADPNLQLRTLHLMYLYSATRTAKG